MIYRLRFLLILSLLITLPPLPFSLYSNPTKQAPSLDSLMQAYGMVDMQTIAPEIEIDLRYATSNNFTGKILYKNLKKAYLEKGFAKKIARAQRILSREKKGYRFIIFDASRPISVQRYMYRLVANTKNKVYVANGKKGGRHNFGVAVDISILNEKGELLDMGTSFDHFGIEAHTDKEKSLVKKGLISQEALKNRQLLRKIMEQVGLRCYRREWWHFQEKRSMQETRRIYQLLNF